jgi:hypothetical protein
VKSEEKSTGAKPARRALPAGQRQDDAIAVIPVASTACIIRPKFAGWLSFFLIKRQLNQRLMVNALLSVMVYRL